MFDLNKLCSEDRRFKQTKLEPFGEFKVKLLTQNEFVDLMSKSESELIFDCVYDVDGEKAFKSIDDIKENVFMADRDLLFNKVLSVNHIGVKPKDLEEK